MGHSLITRAGLAVLSVTFSLATTELVVRTWPRLLGDTFANGALSKYTADSPRGIYYQDPWLDIHFMIPNHRTTMYYNRYVWEHETDAHGFRNRNVTPPADVMLLGDSFIYGHGVDYSSTVGHLLHRLTGLTVANLARQGDCSLQQAYLLTEYLPIFRPRVVFYHFFENDIADLYEYRSDEQLKAFTATPVRAIRFPPRLPVGQALRERDEMFRRRSLLERVQDRLFLYKAAVMVTDELAEALAPAPAQARPIPWNVEEPGSLAWRYTRHAIAYMQHMAARHGAQLVIAPITPTRPHHRARLRAIAQAYGLPMLDTSALTFADDSFWLPGDGHFSHAGAQRLAEIERDYLQAALPAGRAGILTGEKDH